MDWGWGVGGRFLRSTLEHMQVHLQPPKRAEMSLCAVRVYNHRLGRRKWLYNRSVKPAPAVSNWFETVFVQ